MKRWDVEVEFSQKKIIKVYAEDEESAEEKTAEIVLAWENVFDVTDTTCTGESL